jgi:hypothetical protein
MNELTMLTFKSITLRIHFKQPTSRGCRYITKTLVWKCKRVRKYILGEIWAEISFKKVFFCCEMILFARIDISYLHAWKNSNVIWREFLFLKYRGGHSVRITSMQLSFWNKFDEISMQSLSEVTWKV